MLGAGAEVLQLPRTRVMDHVERVVCFQLRLFVNTSITFVSQKATKPKIRILFRREW